MNSGFSAIARRTAEPPISWLMKLTLERPVMIKSRTTDNFEGNEGASQVSRQPHLTIGALSDSLE